jgi:hypothetical protein
MHVTSSNSISGKILMGHLVKKMVFIERKIPETVANNFFVDLLISVADFHLVAAYLHSVRCNLGVSSKLMSRFFEYAPLGGAKPKSPSLTNQGTTKLFCSNSCQYRQ